MKPSFVFRSRRVVGAVSIVLFSGCLITAHPTAAQGARDFRAGPRNTIKLERSVREEPQAQFAALEIDSADLAGARKQRAKARILASERVGPRNTIRRRR